MNNIDPKKRLVSLADSVRAEVLFDMSFKIKSSEFFRVKFDNDQIETKKIADSIYKFFV